MTSRIITNIMLIFFMLSNVLGQDEVKWTFNYDNQSNKVFFKAELKQHWHLYSQFIDEDLGPIPTTFEFSENEYVRRVGAVKENNVQTVYDENFGGSLDIIEGKAVFSQEVILEGPTTLKGSVLFMLCDHNGCLPPDVVEFEIEMN